MLLFTAICTGMLFFLPELLGPKGSVSEDNEDDVYQSQSTLDRVLQLSAPAPKPLLAPAPATVYFTGIVKYCIFFS